MAHSPSESARTLVAGDVPLVAPAGGEPQADAHVRRTRLRSQTREPGAGGPDRRGKNRARLRPPAEGFAEWPPLPVRSGAGPVRRNVCLTGGPIHAPVAESAGAPGRPSDRRIWLFTSQARAVEHVLQADGGALSSPLDDHNDEPWL